MPRHARLLFLTAVATLVVPAARADDARGEEVYRHHCALCHEPGPGHAGTMMLTQARPQGMGVLRERTDLAPEYVAHVVRSGLLEMPPFRPSEIGAEDLAALTRYLAPRRAAP